jgi:hypothetical protein
MLAAYVPNGHSLERRDIVSGEEIPENAVWLLDWLLLLGTIVSSTGAFPCPFR